MRDLEAAPARLSGRSRVGVAVRNANKNDPATDPRGAHRGLTESLPTSAFGTTPIGLFPRPPTADRRAASPRPRASSPPTRRPSSPSFGTPQSEPPILRDIAAPNPAIRSRACLASVSLGRGFVPLSRRRQARLTEWSWVATPKLRRLSDEGGQEGRVCCVGCSRLRPSTVCRLTLRRAS
jgi:hypothetical protein